MSDFLAKQTITTRELYELISPLLNDSETAYLILDDSVQDKRYSTKIELTKMLSTILGLKYATHVFLPYIQLIKR